ncbi:activating signal cointegrator complex [Salix suchowensis]|nr:activating signal cointegrator complex [Salix suchowensis]
MPQAFPPQAFQNPYQAQPQGGQFPPKSPVNGIPVAPVNQQQQAWTTGIFDCLEDPSNALITALFPCVTYGQVAEIVDNGQSCMKRNLNPLLYIQSIIKIKYPLFLTRWMSLALIGFTFN